MALQFFRAPPIPALALFELPPSPASKLMLPTRSLTVRALSTVAARRGGGTAIAAAKSNCSFDRRRNGIAVFQSAADPRIGVIRTAAIARVEADAPDQVFDRES